MQLNHRDTEKFKNPHPSPPRKQGREPIQEKKKMSGTIPEPPSPEYFLESFPREDFPRYVWAEKPAELPAQAWTTETTHRDGQQGGLPLTAEQSLKIYDILCAFTGKSGAIRQA